jgi:hypothetical protein
MVRVWFANLRAKVKRAFAAFRDPLSVRVTVSSGATAPIGPGTSRFVVERRIGTETFALYDGSSGAEARRWYEHVRNHHEPGTMRFLQDGVCRSTYTGD